MLTPIVNWIRTLFIRTGSEIAGYVQFYMKGAALIILAIETLPLFFGVGKARLRSLLYKVMSVPKRMRTTLLAITHKSSAT